MQPCCRQTEVQRHSEAPAWTEALCNNPMLNAQFTDGAGGFWINAVADMEILSGTD